MNRNLGRRTGLSLALLVTLLMAGACGQAHIEPPAGDAARGQALWAQSACAACHGAGAEGAVGGPALVDTPLSVRDVTGLVRRGTVNMPPFAAEQVSDEDLADMYAWWQNPSVAGSTDAGVCVDDVCVAPTAEGAGFSTASATAGIQNPWPQSPCAGCHGVSAEGGIGPALAGTALGPAEFQAAVRQGPGSMPAYSAAELSDQDVQALYDALQAPPAPAVTALPAAAAAPTATAMAPAATSTAAVQQHPWLRVGCANCHGKRAEGGTGPALAGEDWEYEKYVRKVREGDDGMPAFSTARVSDADLQVIYDWLLAGAPAP